MRAAHVFHFALADRTVPWPRLFRRFGWLYVLTMNLVLGIVLFLIGSRSGKIRLGGKTAMPDVTWLGWFAMLFSAGMGIGLLFAA